MPTKTKIKTKPTPAAKIVAEKAAEKPAEVIRNHFMLLLDSSTSMHPYREPAQKIVNENINTIRGETIKSGQDATVTVGTFGSYVDLHLRAAKLDELRVFRDYRPNGNTAMLKAIDDAINCVEERVLDSTSDSYLLIVITDGEENASGSLLRATLPERLTRLQGTDRWSIVFLVPSEHHAQSLCQGFKIPRGNIQVWEQSAAGMERASQSITRGISEYVGSRTRGAKSTTTFFESNAADIKKRDLTKLEDLASETKVLPVKAECVIREFVIEELGSYQLGSAFYELTKDETVQRYKSIAIMERGGRKVYGGDDARALLGLPNTDVRVKIGNHGQYRIFVQSTSVNRKLVRGTNLLVIGRFAK